MNLESSRISPSNRLSSRLAIASLAVAVVGVLILGGCYQRVVRAKGFGADQVTVSEPYQESGKLDEWIFGSPNPANRKPNNTLLPPTPIRE